MKKRVVTWNVSSDPGMVEARYRKCDEPHFGDVSLIIVYTFIQSDRIATVIKLKSWFLKMEQ